MQNTNIRIYNFTLESIILDLIVCITYNTNKRYKLLGRLYYILNYIPKTHLSKISPSVINTANICYKKYIKDTQKNTEYNINELFKKHKFNQKQLNQGDLILKKINPIFSPYVIKLEIEKFLTQAFVKNYNTYTKTCDLFLKIINHLNTKLKFDCEIFARFKGGMSIKKTLLNLYPEDSNNINNYYHNSDNDAIINISPDTPNFDIIFNDISDNIFEFLKTWDDKGIFDTEIQEINNLCLDNKFKYKPTFTLDYNRKYRMSNIIVFKVLEQRKFRITRNFVKIPKAPNVYEMFELIRVKVGFEIKNTVFYAELLDIVIPYKNSVCLKSEFKNKNLFI